MTTDLKESKTMNKQDFSTMILVDQTPKQVFEAVNNVRGWWSENIQGATDKLNAEFLYHYKDVHVCKMKVTEFVPNKKVVWHVLENRFSFTKDKNEWKGNDIVFEIAQTGKQTQLRFTHQGLTQDYECYNVCHDAWTGYITNSLHDLIVKGKGQPTPKDEDGDLNEALIKKWKLNEAANKDYTFVFESTQSPESIFDTLLNVRKWWSGLYGEEINGSNKKLNDVFTFNAGGGAHFSKQQLIELVPGKRIVWEVTESNLSFLNKTDEWTSSKISFDISTKGKKTLVTFLHQGLVPQIECYESCSGAWSQYLENLAEKLK
jgi:hypothetical protein